MSALFSRIADLHQSGHARDDLKLHNESRLIGVADKEFRPAAVLAAITERDRPGLLLIHRPSHMRAHPGQIALPGGKLDAGEDAVTAALREANEELGIATENVRVIGTSDTYRTWTGFEITPVLATIPPDLELIPNPNEVAQWFETPLDFVLNPANQVEVPIDFQGAVHYTWQIEWEEHRIWGVTAALLVNLSHRLGYHG
ncbi:MAG: CoA pyrophosphatase [Novosphingobium sp.]